jgi:hypothetical protein
VASAGAALLLVTGLAGCSYTFNNPAEELQTGEASGTVLTDPLGSGTPVATAGVVVGLKGSAFDQSSRPNGRFIVYDLPAGQHRLLFRDGAAATLERDVELGYGSNGQPDAIDLGEVVVTAAAAVQGSFALPLGFAVASGTVVEERTGLTAMLAVAPDGTATFSFPALSVGSHSFKVNAKDAAGGGSWVGGKVTLDVPAGSGGTTITLATIAGRAASSSGHLRLTVQLLGLSLAPSAVQVWIAPDPLLLSPITPASNGQVDVLVPEGLYQVTITAPATAPPSARLPPGDRFTPVAAAAAPVPTVLPGPAYAVVLGNSPGEAGSLYVASDPAMAAARIACRSTGDCGGSACSGDVCQNYTPVTPPVSGTTSWCAPCTYAGAGATPGYGAPCDAGPGVAGLCFCPASKGVNCATSTIAPVASYCAPQACGFSCTPDGASTVGYTPAAGGPCP